MQQEPTLILPDQNTKDQDIQAMRKNMIIKSK
jgi:hypothetical protein